ncbi:type II toxin-antitoxin system VapC family toxin [Longimicrobium sp.]|uniref:type II toxin-antitoxin system VapC family toxin n=1 Tax=Longimicrobium sp. TaxID=2029185 RepID=UPI003B3B8575
MPKLLAYIETTIPNFYYDFRPSEAVTTRRAWTREWWDSARDAYELVTSPEVLMELSAGTSDLVPLRLALINNLLAVPITPEVSDTANTYIRRKLMPGRPSGDAFHLALASHYKCDFIVTWNCKHLANPNKFAHVRHLNRFLGLPVPEIVTPQDLLRRS